MSNRGPVLKVHGSRSVNAARGDLLLAIAVAEQNRQSIPCKAEPDLWTDDSLVYSSAGGRRRREQAAAGCFLRCPVFNACDAFLSASNASDAPLFGIVAGQLTQDGITRQIDIDPWKASA